jgi:hypothetical protein
MEILEYKNGAHSMSSRILAYAEDVDILDRSEKNHKKMDLKIKEGKTKFMKVTVNPTNTECFKAGNRILGKVSEFK